MEIRELAEGEIDRGLFRGFIRRQDVDMCLRKIDGEWRIVSDPFTDDWNEDEYMALVGSLKRAVRGGGVVYGAFADGALKGFCCVEGEPLGKNSEYLDMTYIHVSRDMRGRGVGRRLFALAADWARLRGAEKLYISAHSAVESQAFYEAVGCVEAGEYNMRHVRMEPCDCQMEYSLQRKP